MGHGSILAGRYRLEDRLHSGPESSLWRAVDETLERQVSLRVVRPDHQHAADIIDAARRAALVDDPRLARVLDVGESEGATYIVTEYVQGRTLTEFLRHGQLPAETVRRIVGEAAQALDRAGSRGLHHLRLTTGSICIVPDGSIKLVGTAIECAAAGMEQDDALRASRADAIGLVRLLYAGLTGRWPGMSDGPLGPAPKVTGRAVAPAELVAGVPGDLDSLCLITLGPDDDGPRSPGELASQLSPWARPTPMTDPQGLMVMAPERPVPPSPRRPTGDAAPKAPPAPPPLNAVGDPTPTPADRVEPDGAAVPAEPDGTAAPGSPTDEEALRDTAPVALPEESTPTDPDAETAVPDADRSVEPAVVAVQEHAETAPTDVEALRAVALARGLQLEDQPPPHVGLDPPRRGVDPFPTDAPLAQPPLVKAPAFPVPGEQGGLRQRVVGQGRDDSAWPTPAPAPATQATTQAGHHATDQRPDVRLIDDPGGPGVRRLDAAPPPTLGRPHSGWSGVNRDDERLGPFMPPVSVARPPQRQARLALVIIGGLVLVGLVLSGMALRTLLPSDNGSAATPRLPSPSGAVASAASPAGSAAASVAPIEIVGVKTLDPQGDGAENDATAPRAIDGATNTAWRSERYDTAQFGGLDKKGVGLLVDLGTESRVAEVGVQYLGTGGTLELRTATDPTLDGSTVVDTVALNGEKLVIRLSQPITTRYLVLWFTKVTRQDTGENRLLVSEVSVR